MIVKPKTRGFICTTAHPVGCARHVADQIAYVKAQGAMTGCKNGHADRDRIRLRRENHRCVL